MARFHFIVTLILMSVLPGCTSLIELAGLSKRMGELEVTAATTTLRVGETVQLRVTEKASGRDLTDLNTGTKYVGSEPNLLSELDGRVTCIGTSGRARWSESVTVWNGELNGRIKFELLHGGPGPSLEVTAERTVLAEGETTQLHVYELLPYGKRIEVTDVSKGTRYLSFAGLGKVDPSVVSINDRGRASATQSIWGLAARCVHVFVRNKDSVGWIHLMVLPKGSGPRLKVVADKSVLQEGETTQLHVYRPLPGGERGKDVTAVASGTRYHRFDDDGYHSMFPKPITTDNPGRVTAAESIGLYESVEVVIFVENGDSTGWTVLKVVPAR